MLLYAYLAISAPALVYGVDLLKVLDFCHLCIFSIGDYQFRDYWCLVRAPTFGCSYASVYRIHFEIPI